MDPILLFFLLMEENMRFLLHAKKKYVAGEFTEEEYAPLKGLRYNMGTNYGTYTSIIKDGDTVGLYKFVIEGIEPYNMEGTPWWYYGIYPADADFSLKQSRNLSTNNCLNNRKRKVKNILYIR